MTRTTKRATPQARVNELKGHIAELLTALGDTARHLAELIQCGACNGTGYATGRCPNHRHERDRAAHAGCPSCEGSGHETV